MDRAAEIASRVETFVRNVVVPFEKDPRQAAHGPSDELVLEPREKARAADVLTPHIMPDGSHLTQRETALVLRMAGLSPLGPLAISQVGAGPECREGIAAFRAKRKPNFWSYLRNASDASMMR